MDNNLTFIDAKNSDYSLAQIAMEKHGCFCLKNAICADELSILNNGVQKLFEFTKSANDESLANILEMPVSHVQGRVDSANNRGVLHSAVASQFIFGNLIELENRLASLLSQETFWPFINDIIGESFLHTNNLAVRYRHPDSPHVSLPFHQDATLWHEKISPSAKSPIMLIVWLPFVSCDESTPGLEIIPQRYEEVFPLSDTPQTNFGHLEQRVPKDLFGVSPKMNIGDCLVFNERTIHRTKIGKFTKPRTSVDLRIIRRNKIPAAIKKTGYEGIELPNLKKFQVNPN